MASTNRPVTTAPHDVIDATLDYTLAPGVAVIPRNPTTVQIGTEASRRILVADAPACAPEVLAGLDGSVPLAAAVSRAGGRLPDWLPLFADLAAAGLLVPASSRPHLAPRLRAERLTLIERHGVATADRLLTARSDAVVVVEGAGALADAAAEFFVAAGIGHVHRPTGAAPMTMSLTASTAPVRPYPPAPQIRPSAVLLTDVRCSGRAAELVAAVVPHLAAQAGPARAVVGPLVLPGRSACLNCVDRHRTDADPDWPRIAAAARRQPPDATPLAVHATAVLAVEQILELIDGLRRPEAVGATIERRPGSLYPRRRPWPRHPDCRCTWVARR